jgi:hypothetical protein
MRKLSLVLLILAAPLHGSDETVAKVVKRAIEAHGGKAALARFDRHHVILRGVVEAPKGDKIPFASELWHQYPYLSRNNLTLTIQGNEIKYVVISGDRFGWIKTNDNLRKMSEPELKSLRQKSYAWHLASLNPLVDDTSLVIKHIGEKRIENDFMIGIRVSSRERFDVDLFFHKQNHFLSAIVNKEIDLKGVFSDVTTVLLDYKSFDGVKYPKKIIKINTDVRTIEEVKEFRAGHTIDQGLFAEPK